MELSKKTIRSLIFGAVGCIVLYWLLHETERLTAFLKDGWMVLSPFIAGAVVAFILNVPMRAIERQLEGIRKESTRRSISIILTLFMLVLLFMFVVELLVPQMRETLDSLTTRIPAFIERTAADLMVFVDDNPDL